MAQPHIVTKVKHSPSYRVSSRFGILNHVGQIWTPETFVTEDHARKYLERQSMRNPTWNLRRYKIIPVRVTVTAER